MLRDAFAKCTIRKAWPGHDVLVFLFLFCQQEQYVEGDFVEGDYVQGGSFEGDYVQGDSFFSRIGLE